MVFRQSVTGLSDDSKQHKGLKTEGPALLHPSMHICYCAHAAVATVRAYRSQ